MPQLTDLPFTAADIKEAEDWLIEQPWPVIRMSPTTPSSTMQEDHHLVTAQGVVTLGPVAGGRRELAAVPRAAVMVEDDLAVEVF